MLNIPFGLDRYSLLWRKECVDLTKDLIQGIIFVFERDVEHLAAMTETNEKKLTQLQMR